LKKLKEKSEKGKKKGGGKKGIRKEGFQFVLIGLPNSGKSSLLKVLTNAQPRIADHPFSTTGPEIGTFEEERVKAQIVDQPSIGSENFDMGLVNTADALIKVVENLEDLEKVNEVSKRAIGKKFVVWSKADRFSENELRKARDKLKSKRIHGAIVSAHSGYGLRELRAALFKEMGIIRVYTKEPGKERTHEPIVLSPGATVKDVAEKILKGFSAKVRETRITGPSGKFPNQKVGLSHLVKDGDVVEFHVK
jgi:hypothetical protein